VAEPAPARSADDPWGAFTQQPAATPVVEAPFEPVQPAVVAPVAEVTFATPAVQSQDDNIGSSWVPDGEQTFEFREEETTPTPFAVTEEAATPEAVPAFSPDAFEPVTAVEPVVEPAVLATAPEITPELPAIVPAAGAVTLTDEQLKEALMAASKETIERIVWEVVPDLAEAMIKEAIKRITEAK